MNHFFYKIKCMLRSKELIFWSLIFPIVLGSMFNFAFGSINEQFQFMQIDVGIVNAKEEDPLLFVLESVKTDRDQNMILISQFQDKETALTALKEEKVQAVIDFSDAYSLTVMESNIESSILKAILDEYRADTSLMKTIAMECYEKQDVTKIEKYVKRFMDGMDVKLIEIPLKGSDKDPFTQYFFALLAMTCLIACQPGLELCNKIQPDLSVIGARRNVSPMKKMTQILIDFFASYVIYCIIISIVVLMIKFGFHRDFGDHFFLVLLASYIGTFTGMTVGTTISVWVKGTAGKKSAMCVMFFMVSSFLAGLQWGDIVYILEKHCPLVNRINPGSLIVNAYSSLMVFSDVKQYAWNVGTLFILGLVFLGLSIMKLRREKYAQL